MPSAISLKPRIPIQNSTQKKSYRLVPTSCGTPKRKRWKRNSLTSVVKQGTECTFHVHGAQVQIGSITSVPSLRLPLVALGPSDVASEGPASFCARLETPLPAPLSVGRGRVRLARGLRGGFGCPWCLLWKDSKTSVYIYIYITSTLLHIIH
jgi:hypothetical protein